MKRNLFFAGAIIGSCCLISQGCQEIPAPLPSTYTFIEPTYDNIQLVSQGDTLHFALDTNSYNEIPSYNYFTQKGRSFIAFYDKNTRSLNTYDFNTRQLVHKLSLKMKIPDESFKKAAAYAVNFDSIFVVTNQSLSLFDSSGTVKQRIELFDAESAKSTMNTETPGVLKGNIFYTSVAPLIKESSLNAQKKWNPIAAFDLQNKTKQLQYRLPLTYQENRFGYSFLNFSYCVNDHGNFVFSFPADTNIYETDLGDLNNAYYAKSRFQSGPIMPLPEEAFKTGDSRKEYYLRDGYGTIYYDPHAKRYLRFAKQKIKESDYLADKKDRKRSVIILDENFKIIGESSVPDTMAFKAMLFVPDGGMYVRVKMEDEHALHFERLEYSDKLYHSKQLTQHKPLPK